MLTSPALPIPSSVSSSFLMFLVSTSSISSDLRLFDLVKDMIELLGFLSFPFWIPVLI